MKNQTIEMTIGSFIVSVGLLFMCCPIVAILLFIIGLPLSMCCLTFPIGLPILALGTWMFSAIPPAIAFGVGISLVILGIIIAIIEEKSKEKK